ncbi:hypothetical protein SEA_BILLNYE_237 [Streptomyces phage BillNye]|uniref:Uncharacterized protein n=2 Tax=Wilnyevirus billnye TaxID=2560486 RepID=A0A2L1IW63_9CAUD|nr:hypothetical protein FDJ30_gp025 [Streptomyces phage BillNye]AVD99406.1 hypothetical protein SEA_BILLNYE_237 [Streptomyces phage BillNye]QBZ72489.1 hypothetical protein SEA_CIRCINUS_236 [Streptomyces phage Circinus]
MKKKGVVRVAGDAEYRVKIRYVKAHTNCGMCTIMHDHEAAPVSGIVEMGKAVAEILEYFSHDIVHSELYSHCERIGVEVERQHKGEWLCDAQYEITRD